jgi:rhodanese-related sulfurtransferase
MTPDEAYRQLAAGELLLIDVRNPDEWARTGVAEGALPIAMQDPEFLTKLDAALSAAPSAVPVAVICASGGRSQQVVNALVARDYDAINVVEGMMGSPIGPGWLGRGLPITEI